MSSEPMSDAELLVVVGVAQREGWADLSSPPHEHGARTLEEQRLVSRFLAGPDALGASPTVRPGISPRLRARLLMIATAVVVLGVCWWVSPARTALGLLGAGVVLLVAMRRRSRAADRRRGIVRPRFGRPPARRL